MLFSSNYAAVLEPGLGCLGEGFPLSIRLLREIHAALLSRGRGSDRGRAPSAVPVRRGDVQLSTARYARSAT